MIDWNLTEEQAAIQDMARRFAQKEIAPYAREVDLSDSGFPEELLGKMAKQGFFGMGIGAEYGGLGLDTVSMGLVTEEFCRASLALGSIVQRNWLCGHILEQFGTEEQKLRWLPGMASGQLQSCTSGTEPEAGSDAANDQDDRQARRRRLRRQRLKAVHHFRGARRPHLCVRAHQQREQAWGHQPRGRGEEAR